MSRSLFALGFALFLAGCPSGEEDIRKAHVYFKNQDFEKAEAHYRAALERSPRSTVALEGLGNVAFERGKPADAIEWYEKALAQNEGDISVRHKLSVVLQSAGRTDDAIRTLERTLEIEPKQAFASYALGGLLEKKGNLAGAEKSYLTALVAHADYHAARFALANLMIDAARYEEADRELATLMRRGARPLAEYGLARAEAAQGRYPEAALRLERVLELGLAHPERVLDDSAFAKGWGDPRLAAVGDRIRREAAGAVGTSTAGGG